MTPPTEWAITAHNVSNLRAEPHERAEVVSQSLLGEAVEVLARSRSYVRVQTPDGYTGWMLHDHLQISGTPQRSDAGPLIFVCSAIARLNRRSAAAPSLLAPFGAQVRRIAGRTPAGSIPVAWPYSRGWRHGVVAGSDVTAERPEFSATAVCRLAVSFTGVPYLWGGITPFGFDCSGLVQRTFGWFGVQLPRDAWMQAEADNGKVLSAAEASDAGDLLFFRSAAGVSTRRITHVAICLSPHYVVHASVNGVEAVRRHSRAMRSRYQEVSAWRFTG